LTKTAGYLWKNCDGKKTIEELIKQVCLKFEVDETKALSDIKIFIDQMKSLQLAALSEPGP